MGTSQDNRDVWRFTFRLRVSSVRTGNTDRAVSFQTEPLTIFRETRMRRPVLVASASRRRFSPKSGRKTRGRDDGATVFWLDFG